MSAKRHKAGGTCSASCKEGLLNDHTDTMELMAKRMALALDESMCRSILHSCKAIAKRISLGGICIGSGTGSVAIMSMMEELQQVVGRHDIELEHGLNCEYMKRKRTGFWKSRSPTSASRTPSICPRSMHAHGPTGDLLRWNVATS